MPMHEDPLLGIAGMLQRKGNPIHLVPVPMQKLPEECQFDSSSDQDAFLLIVLVNEKSMMRN